MPAPREVDEALAARRESVETLLDLVDATCPRIFTLHRVKQGQRSWFNRATLGLVHQVTDTFRLQLYCESSKEPVGEPYEFTGPTELVQSFAPLVRALDPMLKGLRIVLADPPTFLQIEAMRAGAKETAEWMERRPGIDERDALEAVRGAAYRVLKNKLKELDPTDHYHGMERVTAPNGRTVLWVSPAAAEVLRRPPVVIPPPSGK
jgi:hypothetical protein